MKSSQKLIKELCAVLDKHPRVRLGAAVAALTFVRDGLDAYIRKPRKRKRA